MILNNDITIKRNFKHLNEIKRGQIKAYYSMGYSYRKIAGIIGCSPSTISREIKRGTVTLMGTLLNQYEEYLPETSQIIYERNRKVAKKPFKLAKINKFIEYIEDGIKNKNMSVDSLCGRAKKLELFSKDKMACTKTIYNYIDLNLLKVRNIDLPLRVRRNNKRNICRKNRKIFGTSIEERPEDLEKREEFGHWEIDTMIGKKSCDEVILTLDERKTRKRIMIKIDSKTADSVNVALENILKYYEIGCNRVFKTITSDNGSEFSKLNNLSFNNTKIYYAHPYSSFERGTNEKQNSLVRRFIPKGVEIKSISVETIDRVNNWINELPRKILDYNTPQELFDIELNKIYFEDLGYAS